MTTKHELLDKLRAVKEAKGLSYSDIVRITEENGEAISIATVQRIFRKGSDVESFRYHKTLRPIARAILGMDEELEVPVTTVSKEQAEEYIATIDGLRTLADMKHEQITSLQDENEYLKGIVEDYKNEIKWHRRISLLLSIVTVFALAALVIVSLFK